MKTEVRHLFDPAIRFLNQYAFFRKFAIIGALLALPLMFVTFQFIDALNERVETTHRELAGNRAIQMLVPLWTTLREERFRVRAVSADEAATHAGRDNFRSALNGHIACLDGADSQTRKILHCSARWAAFQGKVRVFLQQPSADPQIPVETSRLKEMIDDVSTMFRQVADEGSLTLDPHLDSQNLAVTFARMLPDLVGTQDRMRDLISAGEGRSSTQSADVELAEVRGGLKVLLSRVEDRLGLVFQQNPALASELRNPLALCRQSIRSMEEDVRARIESTVGKPPNEQGETPPHADADASVPQATAQTLALMSAGQDAFGVVVQKRCDDAQVRRVLLILATCTPLVIAAYLLVGLCLAIVRTANRMEEVTDSIVRGEWNDNNVQIVDTHDELGQMIRHFGRLAIRLREGWLSAHSEAVRASEAEESLRENQKRFELVLQGTNDGIWDWDLAADRVLYSDRFKELLGYGDQEFGVWLSALSDLLHPEDFDHTWKAVERHLHDGEPYLVEHRLKVKSGEYRWFLERGQAVWDQDGIPVRMAGSISDITERKATEDRERIRNAAFELLATGAPLAQVLEQLALGVERAAPGFLCCLLLADKSGQSLKLGAGPSLPETGKAALQFVPVTPGMVASGASAPLGERVIIEEIQSHPYCVPYRELAAQHGVVSCFVEAIRGESGIVLGTVCFLGSRIGSPNMVDIKLVETVANVAALAIQRKQVEETMRASEERWKFALEGARDGVWDWNIETGETIFSRRWLEMLGFANHQVEYSLTGWISRLYSDDLDGVMATLQECLDGISPTFSHEHRLLCRDGSFIWVLSRGIVVSRNADGRALRMIGTHSDITGRKQMEEERSDYLKQVETSRDHIAEQSIQLVRQSEELARARDQAEAAARAKSEFLANMSHELRTPLTAILGFADVLADNVDSTSVTPQQREAIDIIRTNGHHLHELINDVLDLSKLEAGSMMLELRPVSTRKLVENVLQTMQLRAKEKGLTLVGEFGESLPAKILTDALRLRQILVNLIGNAIKFTGHGKVSVHVRYDETTHSQTFSVSDTGVGIKPQQLALLFRPFSQADATMSRRFGGTGLGLSISQRLARMLGGDLRVESSFGTGSTFTLTIAAKTGSPSDRSRTMEDVSPSPPPQEPALQLVGRILLAEDVVANQKLIAFLLQKAGAHVDVVENGMQAVAGALEAEGAAAPYDLILMDIQMPEMDGYAATAALRAAGYHGRIVALTAHASDEDRDQCLASGFDGFATKPIQKNQLLATCREQLRTVRAEMA